MRVVEVELHVLTLFPSFHVSVSPHVVVAVENHVGFVSVAHDPNHSSSFVPVFFR